MKQKSWHLDRRTFLRGSGLSLALPFMNAMAVGGEEKALDALPKRAAFIFFPNGCSHPSSETESHEDWYWFPKGAGRDYTFRTSQKYLNPFREDISVMSGLSHPANRLKDAHKTCSAFLTAFGEMNSVGLGGGNSISIDQTISKHLEGKTQLPSLVLSTHGGVGHGKFTLSFDEKGRGVPALANLREIYQKMYIATDPAAMARLKRKKAILLNTVYPSAKDLSRRLGKEDRETLDEYLASVTDLEKKIENRERWASRTATKAPELELDIKFTDVEKYMQTVYELIYLAFKADITRVATYQIAPDHDSKVVKLSNYIGLGNALHSMSHAKNWKTWGMWDQFVSRQLAYLINRLKETKEGDGCLLDRCLIFEGSPTSITHKAVNYPLILAGGKKMGHKTGQFVQYDEAKNALSNLFVRMAHAMDVPIETFGDSTGIPMTELFS